MDSSYLSHTFLSINFFIFVCVFIPCYCLAGLVSLNLLDLRGNLFSSVPRHLPPSVQQLYLSNNSLSGLDKDSFVGLLNLKYLRLSRCGLQSSGVHSLVFNFSSLLELDLSYNKLTTIPTIPTTLRYLYLEANEIHGGVHTYRKKMYAYTNRCSRLSHCECRGVTDREMLFSHTCALSYIFKVQY